MAQYSPRAQAGWVETEGTVYKSDSHNLKTLDADLFKKPVPMKNSELILFFLTYFPV